MCYSKGNLRFAYATLVKRSGKFEKFVAKNSLYKDDKKDAYLYNKQTIILQIIAKYLAEKFIQDSSSQMSVKFLNIYIMQLTDTGEYYTLEEYLDGNFAKWSNNLGYVNESEYSHTLDAFSHWSYQSTNEYLLVADLQGFFILEKDKFLLTDPAIACAKDPLRFGSTNLGQKGIKVFFSKHRCNHICKSLNLKKHKYQILPDLKTDDTGTVLKA